MTVWLAVPTLGVVLGVAKENVPGTLATPPVSAEEASDCPYAMAAAVGFVVMVGVALPIVKSRLFVPV